MKTCTDVDTPLEACSFYSIRPKDKANHKYAYAQKAASGELPFKPVGVLSFEEKERGAWARRWVLYLVDNSGAAAAQERFVVLDGAYKPMTKVMTYVEKEKYFKGRPKPEDMDIKCKAVSKF